MRIRRLLVANRGEIACRVMRTAAKMGIKTTAVHTHQDLDAMHTRHADNTVRLRTSDAPAGYLDGKAIIAAARAAKADALHPGYGFLSENPAFAKAVGAAGITFIGPPAAAMAKAGSKTAMLCVAKRLGIPTLLEGRPARMSPRQITRIADKLKYPVLVKATSGGGGRGIRVVRTAGDIAKACGQAAREAERGFGDGRLYVERYLDNVRHVEVQLLVGKDGKAQVCGDRDCSLQRRHQKVVEEAPAPFLPERTRRLLHKDAVRLAEAIGYRNAGTVEFLVSADGKRHFFIEVNARLQVEHTVTEEAFGADLVQEQIEIAQGKTLPATMGEPARHAIEARVCAENPLTGFLPTVGMLRRFDFSLGDGDRLDAGYQAGDVVSGNYDSLLAKAVSKASTRDGAIGKLQALLSSAQIAGVATNVPFLAEVLGWDNFKEGAMSTRYIEAKGASTMKTLARKERDMCALGAAGVCEKDKLAGFRLNERHGATLDVGGSIGEVAVERRGRRRYHVSGQQFAVDVRDVKMAEGNIGGIVEGARTDASFFCDDGLVDYFSDGSWAVFDPTSKDFPQLELENKSRAKASGTVVAPMHGTICTIDAKVGDKVKAGQALVSIEAMKMETAVVAETDGVLASLGAKVGEQVKEGQFLAQITA